MGKEKKRKQDRSLLRLRGIRRFCMKFMYKPRREEYGAPSNKKNRVLSQIRRFLEKLAPALEERLKKLTLVALDDTLVPAYKDTAKAELLNWAKSS